MDKLHELIREVFIECTDGEFLNWPEDEQRTAIQRIAADIRGKKEDAQ